MTKGTTPPKWVFFDYQNEWFLNLPFQDSSGNDWFSVTYVKAGTWFRVRASIDYRKIEANSLESQLQALSDPQERSSALYKATRDSLPKIQFQPTATMLKFQTVNGQLKIRVTEDMKEIIEYPPLSRFESIACRRTRESEVKLESHISKFVYTVWTPTGEDGNSCLYVKKDIPSPDSVVEFLDEINLLNMVRGSPYIVELQGLVISNDGKHVKSLLLTYHQGGTLADLLLKHEQRVLDSPHICVNAQDAILSAERRIKWACQILCGLNAIHSRSCVHGNFTLKSIVIDPQDNACILIKRRGCRIGWEPPEFKSLIQSGIGLDTYIGAKSDIWQCGMMLWALAKGIAKPEREELGNWNEQETNHVPGWCQDVVAAALQETPGDRKSALELLNLFPTEHRSNCGINCGDDDIVRL